MSAHERLAIEGGLPVLPLGPPGWPLADEAVLAALQDAYADGSWGRYEGRLIDALTAALAEMHQVPFVLPCSSGTVAIELALRGLGISTGDEVLLAGYDFPGNFRAIEAVGARPALVDLAAQRWCPDVEQLDGAQSAQTRALIVSHLHGGLASMRAICDWARERQVYVIEDACQAIGARVNGRVAGTWGDVGVLSFGGSKLVTAGRGGALLTGDAQVHQRAKIYCERGNHAFPLSQLQAAVILPQLVKLATRNQQRHANVMRLLDATRDLTCLAPVRWPAEDFPSFYKLAWRYEPDECGGQTREALIAALQGEGVALDAGFRGFARRGSARCRRAGPLNLSIEAAAHTLLLHHPVLLEPLETIDRVADAFRKVVAHFRR